MKKASLTGCPTTLEHNISFRSRFESQYFLEVSALLDVRYCHKLQSCAMSRKTNHANLRI